MKTITLTALALIVSSVVNAQDIRSLMGRQVLSDRTSEKVVQYRRSLNDSLFFTEVRKRDMYLDIEPGYDGNATYPTVEASKRQASQSFALTGIAAVNYFDGNAGYSIGFGGQYGYRRWLFDAEVAFLLNGKGTAGGKASKVTYSGHEVRLAVGYEIASWRNHHHQIYVLGGPAWTQRRHDEFFTFGETVVANRVKANTLGFIGGIRYQGSPRMSRFLWFIQLDAGYGVNFGAHDNGTVQTLEYFSTVIGGTENAFNARFTVGIGFNVFNKTIRRNNKAANY